MKRELKPETDIEREAREVRERQERAEADEKAKYLQSRITVLDAIKRRGVYWPGE